MEILGGVIAAETSRGLVRPWRTADGSHQFCAADVVLRQKYPA
jgi:hypothetical protein